MKIAITNPAFVAAIKKATAPLKGERSIPLAVTTVKAVKKPRLRKPSYKSKMEQYDVLP